MTARSTLFTIMATLVFSVANVASASPISISFDTTSNNVGGAGNNTPVGEPSNVDGLQLPGQTGAWQSLIVGNGYAGTTTSVERSILVDGNTVTFRLNTGGAGTFQTYLPLGAVGDDLRSAVAFLRRNPAGGVPQTSASISWEIVGLNQASYDLILFGQEGAVNPAAFAISGHDAGNGVGAAVTLDSENDGNFTNVYASGGVIQGTFSLGQTGEYAAWSGLQFQQVPTPGNLALMLTGLLGFGIRRRRV